MVLVLLMKDGFGDDDDDDDSELAFSDASHIVPPLSRECRFFISISCMFAGLE